MDLAIILKFIRENTDWLYTVIYQNQFFFLDYWSVVHFLSGFFLPVILYNLNSKRIYSISILILFFYEIVEISLIYLAFNIFRPETIKDQFTDLIIGSLGVILIWKNRNADFSARIYSYYLPSILSAFIISFLWVGFYNYKYNIEMINTAGLNIWAFSWWFAGLLFILFVAEGLKNTIKNKFILYQTVYLIYLFCLLTFEYLGYNVFNIRKISDTENSALIFNLIHGTTQLHIFYLIAPLLTFLLYSITRKIFISYFKGIKEREFDSHKNLSTVFEVSE